MTDKRSLDWELMVRASLEQHSRRLEALESQSEDRVSVHVHNNQPTHDARPSLLARSIPPQVRKHGGSALVSALVVIIIEGAQVLARHWP